MYIALNPLVRHRNWYTPQKINTKNFYTQKTIHNITNSAVPFSDNEKHSFYSHKGEKKSNQATEENKKLCRDPEKSNKFSCKRFLYAILDPNHCSSSTLCQKKTIGSLPRLSLFQLVSLWYKKEKKKEKAFFVLWMTIGIFFNFIFVVSQINWLINRRFMMKTEIEKERRAFTCATMNLFFLFCCGVQNLFTLSMDV